MENKNKIIEEYRKIYLTPGKSVAINKLRYAVIGFINKYCPGSLFHNEYNEICTVKNKNGWTCVENSPTEAYRRLHDLLSEIF